MLLVVGDRATYHIDGERVPVEEIVVNTAKSWIKENLRHVDPDTHVKYQIELKHGSIALRDIFKRSKGILGANDTSAAVGYAPRTKTEENVFDLERFLNSKKFKKEFPETGEDVKVMGLRIEDNLQLTISMPFVDRFIDSESTYFRKKEEVLESVKEFLKEKGDFKNFQIYMNNLDTHGRGVAGLYLTVLGTSADGADCGQVGRGNRVDGLISLTRPAGSEAAAGKNPVSHVGKIYSVLSFRLSQKISEIPGVREAIVWLLSRIGVPINKPSVIDIQIISKDGLTSSILKEVEEVTEEEMENIQKLCKQLALGKIKVC
jgi:S-adenosylmethionine synthetase